MNRGVWLAGAILVGANAFALGGAAWNRSQVVSRVELTNEDLTLWGTSSDDSSMSLHLNWSEYYYATAHRFSDTTLRELGFEAPALPDVDRRRLPRRAFVVLAVGNPEKQRWLDQYYAHQPPGSRPDLPNGNLTVVDIGADPETLRRSYADPSHFLILHAMISASWDAELNDPHWVATIDTILPDVLNVPANLRAAATQIVPSRYQPPGFVATVCVGRRGEPWIENIRPR